MQEIFNVKPDLSFDEDELVQTEKIVLSFLQNVRKLELSETSEDGRKWDIKWQYGRSQDTIESESIPAPYQEEFVSFSWLRIPVYPEGASDAEIDELNKRVGYVGSPDIRMISSDDGLLFSANIGALQGTMEWWQKTVGSIPYPIKVEDRHGFEYTNEAFKQQHS